MLNVFLANLLWEKQRMEKSFSKRIIVLACVFVVSFMAYFAVSNVVLQPAQAQAATYKLEVNTKKCVVTAYVKKSGKWVPYRAMICSPGASGSSSPHGTFKLKEKYRWLKMKGGVYSQYCSYIAYNCLFHSVWYYKESPKTQSTYQYNQLGKRVSHGCVRLSTVDAKWVYDNCKRGTKVHISKSAPTPLGKPKLYKVKGRSESSWDPTDPDTDNKYINLKKIVIKNGSSASIKIGSTKTLSTRVYSKAKGFKTGFVDTKKRVKFSSNNKSVATVSSKGKITVKKLGTATITAKITRNGKTVKAKFTVKACSKIKFYANEGKLNGKNSITQNVYGSLSSIKPVREGYMFKGWYTAQDGGSKVTTPKKGAYTLYAHWVKDPEPQTISSK